MRETLLAVLLTVCFIGVISAYFINGRSIAKSIGVICAIIIACALSYQLFVPLSEGVSVHSLMKEIMTLAFAPLAALLIIGGIYYLASGAHSRRFAQAAAQADGASESISSEAQKNVAFAKKRKTGKDRLADMRREADSAKSRKRDERNASQAEAKNTEVKYAAEQEAPSPETKVAGRERLEALLKSAPEAEPEKEEPATPDLEDGALEDQSANPPSEVEANNEALEEDIEEALEEEQEEYLADGNAQEVQIDQSEAAEEDFDEENSIEPIARVSDASLRILDKAGQMKASGGFKLAAALYQEYLKNPADEQSKTVALQGLLDCYISLKQNLDAREIAQALEPRLDEAGSNKMKLLLKLLK